MYVSIATARKVRRGFQLVYVNSAFEEATGYKRSDIVGHNCEVLQSEEETEEDSICRLIFALRNSNAVKVAITNRKKSGEALRNLLSIKPVYDGKGVYSYVVGVQFDITSTLASEEQLRMANDVMRLIPDIILV